MSDMRGRAHNGDQYVLIVTTQNPNGKLRGLFEPA
jgi:hypothetical protein